MALFKCIFNRWNVPNKYIFNSWNTNSSCFKISNYAKVQNDGLHWPKVGYKSLYFANYTETVKKKMHYTLQYYLG